ncbi:AAA family ATPase [Candidatus Woesearchaeota archaeon]|nr:AAA family ATPase [Candidatus Woesearchaeota archaeon]
MHKIIALVGLCGSGKTTAKTLIEKQGFTGIRLDDIIRESLRKNNKSENSLNIRDSRNELRNRYGLSALALLNLDRIQNELKINNVVIDGLYTLEEYLELKKEFKDLFIVVAIATDLELRYSRLKDREDRAFTKRVAKDRDYFEITKLHKGGPIALANYFITNNTTLQEFEESIKTLTQKIIRGKNGTRN